MQLYVLDRAKNTLATTSSFYSDKHHKELTAGASIFEFTIDKSDSAAQYMTTGNYLVFKDDRGRAWSFTILSYDETQTTKTVAAEDVSIELLNKAMDVWSTTQAYPFSYYFNLVTKGTPWTLGVNQLTDLSRKLVYTGRDTGLGRLLSVLKGFDNAECQFNIKVQQNKPVEFTVDVYKSIGTVQDNIQIVYNNELADIKKTESRAQFVTALAGVGGLVENQATTDPGLEKHIDFTDIDYKDDNFVSPKGDKFLRAVTANKTFNPGTTTYIEDFYDYDTQSAQELLNRTLTQLKERSEPQYTYDADVKVIDPTLDIGDTVTIIDHDYNPALYLQARVATLDKSYTDPTQGAITFCNYRVLNSNLSDQLRAMQNIIDQLPTSASIKVINNNIVQMITQNEELKKQVALSFESANGKSRVWFSRSSTAQNGDIAFIKNADGATEIWKFVEGVWTLDTGLATFEDVKKAASAAADAGSQAVIAGQQASAAGADAKSAGDFAASAASQSTIETAAAKSAANSAVDQAKLAISQAGFANDAADQAKSAAASAKSDAADALAEATKSFNDAQTAISNATKAMDAAEQNRTTVTGLVTKVDDIAGKIQTLATTQSVDKLAGTVTTVQNLAQFAADGLKLKADTTTVNQINGTVNDIKGELDVQADKIAATVTASDVTGMLNGYATQSWSQGQISAAKNEITASVQTLTSDMATQTWTRGRLELTESTFKTQISSVVTSQLDNMQVGIRNLIPNGSFNDGLNGWTVSIKPGEASNAIRSAGNETLNGNHFIFMDGNNSTSTTYVGDISSTASISLEPNTEYSLRIITRSKTTHYLSFLEEKDSSGAVLNDHSFKVIQTDNSKYSENIQHFTTSGSASHGTFRLRLYPGDQFVAGEIILVQGNKLPQDWVAAPEDMATVTQFTSIEETLKGVQTTANNAVTQTQYTQLSDQFTTTIANVGAPNLVDESGFSGASLQVGVTHGFYRGGHTLFRLNNTTMSEVFGSSASFAIKPNTKYTLSFLAFASANVTSSDVWLLCRPAGTTASTHNIALISSRKFSPSSVDQVRVTFTTSATDELAYVRFDNNGSTDGKSSGLFFTEVQIEEGTVATPYRLSDNQVSSQFTQLQDDINLRVKTGDLINQINVSTEGILIDGAKTHITNTTTIDNGVIKNASIADAAITTAKIGSLAVNTAQIANGAINSAKIASLAVGTAQIADGAISTAKIGTAAITSAQIADASILDAKIVSLDGSKIVAHSITADQLDVNAIAVGLNTYGAGWQITPASIAFLPAGTTHTTIALSGDMGITYGDLTTGEILGHTYGTPYNTNAGMDWYNGISTVMKYKGADYWGVFTEESTGVVRPRLVYSRGAVTDFGLFDGWTIDAPVTMSDSLKSFGNITASGSIRASTMYSSTDAGAGVWLKRGTIGGHAAFNIMNANQKSGIAFTDDGTLYLGRTGKWYDLYDIVNKIGIA